MTKENLSVREIKESDFKYLVDYFLCADKDFLKGLGVDITKLPKREEWLKLLENESIQKYQDKKFFYIIWLLDNRPIGHSNINAVFFGEDAYMHLHLWDA